MANRDAVEPASLLDYVKALENQDSRRRGELVRGFLESLGVGFTVQRSRHPRIENIIVDFLPESPQELGFSAHYDVVRGSPGANDNASGVAVLLGLCRTLKASPAPARVIFFDREEAWVRTPFLRLGLLGSLYYVFRHDLNKLRAVFNLEFCGSGDCLAIWPIKDGQKRLPAFEVASGAAAKMGLPAKTAHVPWLLLSSDHFSFRIRGLANAITLSLLPSDQAAEFEGLIARLNVFRLLTGHRPALPGVLATVHTPADTASRMNEASLSLMLSLLRVIVETY